MTKYIIAVLILGLSFNTYASEIKNEKAVGLLLGDPIAISLKLPVKEKTFLNIRAGIWTWSFWHDIKYDTPYLSVDYAWLFPVKQFNCCFYIGAGMAFFFADNPKDENDYDAAAAIRLPLGIDLYNRNNLYLGFEIAPIYQFAPAFNAKPYVIELNGGLVLNFYY